MINLKINISVADGVVTEMGVLFFTTAWFSAELPLITAVFREFGQVAGHNHQRIITIAVKT
jgi:hypothetical protein